MRWFALSVILFLVPALVAADKDAKPLTVEEAAKKVNEKVTVEMEVKSSKLTTTGLAFLNSEADFKDAKNFTVMIGKTGLEKFKEQKIDDPAAHFKGKKIRVTGTVKLYKDKPEIVVDDPKQIEIVEKKEK